MRKAAVNEIRRLAGEDRGQIEADARRFAREPKIYLHWPAGTCQTLFDGYHINITGEGRIFINHQLNWCCLS